MNKTVVKKVGIWFLAFSLFAVHFFSRGSLHAEEGVTWKQMFTQAGECNISFPSTPQMIQQSLPLGDGMNRLQYDVYLAPHEDTGVFLLLVATYPMPISGGNEAAGLEGLLSGIVNHNPDNQLIYADLTQLLGHPAMDFLVEGGKSYFRGQATMIGNKLYLIAMEGLKGQLNEKVYTKFLQSFQLRH
ncbi:MAG: hypothetical protein A3D96_03355 [Chlamydiae bacterium RIFCSPHIGHO2_12_FULL_44_59]|nr:MAG: hypothetical protein A2796_06005 [Chlamydiae bacterium RIFCSPHIGHO2_01_FULL_44_39]OGN58560.1 MAG: hypothetical protein A3C42_06505 [Chlamydiae bacterium RIFCSPHIGHO2_02_FULL_45_9]OGN60613.1 MAG: hypothetical protein A3D96_03355 [Chlamydiae bacterium RIFCSPHIGHO2_12_FULL_44_59]OGN66430.1 MAG: hypothetical protein A2978_03870 [Chlamydiae bacterium RIFCSPLOWO2_01_FULL_44_52]OGN69492.1 MAG: hypothetical protein A3I67_04105 [Chlamydiae bacterium RIFCSPLOWO2_02_FULL_45_22]OGN70750.1 MAG: hyp